MHYVYILLLKNSNLYTGQTDDLRRRKDEHNNGKVSSTKNYLPVKLVHYEGYLFKVDALRREKYLKTSDGKRDLKRQLSFVFKTFNVHNSGGVG